ncbi:MAG TPA: AIR synthase related protein, partial [Thermoanaerobaculia bacterium]|nr:AIR synthase related protein [Thermoanaerobaculia bacterium]
MSAIPGRVTLKQGGGGRAMRALIEKLFIRDFAAMPFDGVGLAAMDDGAAIPLPDGDWLIVTTDSHVIHPIFFPGGDIGRISIAGTVNDLTMMGATRILGLTCGVVLEEGFPLDQLEAIQRSIVATCLEAGTVVITGDTKVMGHGEIDGIVINTTGIGIAPTPIRDNGLRAGDRIVVTGTVGDHGLAVMCARNGIEL